MTDRDNITLPREAVEKAVKAFENGCPPTCENGMIDSGGLHPWGQPALVPCPACLAFEHLRTALAAEQPSEEAEALRRDAERYRWLRERAWFQFEFDGRYGDSGETVQELDAAIDAAMGDKT